MKKYLKSFLINLIMLLPALGMAVNTSSVATNPVLIKKIMCHRAVCPDINERITSSCQCACRAGFKRSITNKCVEI